MISQFALRNQIYDLSQARGRARGSFRERTLLPFLAPRVQKEAEQKDNAIWVLLPPPHEAGFKSQAYETERDMTSPERKMEDKRSAWGC